jgi:hypothetical protein
VEASQTPPEEWLESVVGQGAQARWREWLDAHRAGLAWDAQSRAFVE